MVYYRLCVSTFETDTKIAFAYAFYNQHDFCVYKRTGECEHSCELDAYIDVCAKALLYFVTHIRTRYYTEHFSELLSEDGGIVLCPDKELVAVFDAYREGRATEKKSEYTPLYEFFDIPSISFVYEQSHALQKKTAELL